MSSFELEPPSYLSVGTAARLIPGESTGVGKTRERRALSALLATFMAVDEYGNGFLSEISAPSSKNAKIECFTEIAFGEGDDTTSRPDGLIIVSTGRTEWRAIIEAKIGSEKLDRDQIERYLRLARDHGVDAVITISNELVPSPLQSPVRVNRQLTRSVSLFHWSWASLFTEALLQAKYKGIKDSDQAYILQQLVLFLDDDSSGVSSYRQMPSSWKTICTNIRSDLPLRQDRELATDVVSSWFELVRSLSLKLSIAVGKNVSIYLPRKYKNNQALLQNDTLKTLMDELYLDAEFDIPDAASRLYIWANLNARALTVSMSVQAPLNRNRSSACVTWLRNQLSECENEAVKIKAYYRRAREPKTATLGEIREDRNFLSLNDASLLPTRFEIEMTSTSIANFSKPRGVVQDAQKLVKEFYKEIGQHLNKWMPQAPKIIKSENNEEDTETHSDGITI
jgi:hypothetical protein